MQRLTVPLLVIVFSFFPGASADDMAPWEPMWMALSHPALNSIAIMIENPSKTAKKVGVTERLIYNAVELGLRRNKIRVDEDLNSWSTRLSIEFNTAIALECGDEAIYAYRIGYALWMLVGVKLPRFGIRYVRVDLWRAGVSGAATARLLPERVREFLSEQTDSLSLDYLRAEAEHQRDVERWFSTIK